MNCRHINYLLLGKCLKSGGLSREQLLSPIRVKCKGHVCVHSEHCNCVVTYEISR